MAKKIYITPFFEKNRFNKIVYSLNEEWLEYLSSLGFEFEILTPYSLKKLNAKNDGIIISGGGDIYKIKKSKTNLLRDNFEKKVIKYCQKKKIKILGICRGLQLMASINNCTLKYSKNHRTKIQHKLYLKSNKYIKSKTISVNSHHNYKLEKISNNFEKIAYAPDGSCEIIIHKKKNFLGFMFHPERKNLGQNQINIFIKKWFS